MSAKLAISFSACFFRLDSLGFLDLDKPLFANDKTLGQLIPWFVEPEPTAFFLVKVLSLIQKRCSIFCSSLARFSCIPIVAHALVAEIVRLDLRAVKRDMLKRCKP